MKIRIKFEKTGNMKFIGHLDVMRYFQKVMRRAEVNICYSGGYSPHQIMSFAAPLGLGLTSEGEYMDIEVNETLSSKEMVERLNAVMVEGIKVKSYRYLPDDTKNAMSIVTAADYVLAFREGYEPADFDGFFDKLKAFYAQDSITILKKTKKSEVETDIKPFIYDLRIVNDKIFLSVATGSANNLKPELVMQAFYEANGMEFNPFTFLIHRLEIYAVSKDGDGYISLEDMGEEIV
ncbi:MAG: TIGR03936 family radical SAM-associated protein [Lachnospiraceae bacterium]